GAGRKREWGVDGVPHVGGGENSEHCKLLEWAGMIEREPIADAAAAVVSGKAEVHKTDRLHRFHHGLRHGALGVWRMVDLRPRRCRPAITRQIGDHEREMFAKRRREAVPHHVALRMTMKE